MTGAVTGETQVEDSMIEILTGAAVRAFDPGAEPDDVAIRWPAEAAMPRQWTACGGSTWSTGARKPTPSSRAIRTPIDWHQGAPRADQGVDDNPGNLRAAGDAAAEDAMPCRIQPGGQPGSSTGHSRSAGLL